MSTHILLGFRLDSFKIQNKISPSIGILLYGVLIPNLLNNPFAFCWLIDLDFLLLHIAYFHNIIILPLLVLETCRFIFFVYFLHFKQYDFIFFYNFSQ